MYSVQRQPRSQLWRGARFVVLAVVILALAWGSSTVHGAATPQHARVEGSNPNLGQRLIYLERWRARNNGRMPQTVVIGSSRSTFYDPRQIKQLTGRTTFNAGISDGGARSLRAMVDWLNLRSGGAMPQMLIFADLETFDGRTPQVRTRLWQEQMTKALDECKADPSDACRERGQMFARSLANDATRRQGGAPGWQQYLRSDGRQVGGNLVESAARGVNMNDVRRRRIAIRVQTYGPGDFDNVDPVSVTNFDHILKTANDAGVRPLVVLTPTHPDCIRICGRAGWAARRSEVRSTLAALKKSRDFRWIDYSYPAMYGGNGSEFFDEVHLRPQGAAMVIRSLDRRGLLAPPATQVASSTRVSVEESAKQIIDFFAA